MNEADYQLAVQNRDRAGQLAYCDYLRDRGDDDEADKVYLRLLVSELSDEPAIALMRDLFEGWVKQEGPPVEVAVDHLDEGSLEYAEAMLARLERQSYDLGQLQRQLLYNTLGEWAENEIADGEVDGPSYAVAYASQLAQTYADQLPPEWAELFWAENISPDGWKSATVRP